MTLMGVSGDVAARIALEVTLGYEWGDPRSKVEATDDARVAWREISGEVAEIEAAGLIADAPFDTPDFD